VDPPLIIIRFLSPIALDPPLIMIRFLSPKAVDLPLIMITFLSSRAPLRIQVRIGPPHPHACHMRRLNGGGPSDETVKTEVLCHSRCGTIKIPPCSKALSAEHRPKFCSPTPAMVTSPYK
jgi:hypothetical protein